MKKTLSYSVVLSAALVLAIVSPVLAEDMMTTTAATGVPALVTSPSPKATAKNKLADPKERVASKPADLRMPLVASGGGSLKDRLKLFKDQKKVVIIERISQAFLNINQRRTSEMLRHVDTMTMILGKAQDRANAASGEAKDVSSATPDLTSAANALANAKTAVETQSKKTYDIKIASESGVRADVRLSRDALEKDLKSTHELVKEARRTLINALVKLAQALGEQVNATN